MLGARRKISKKGRDIQQKNEIIVFL